MAKNDATSTVKEKPIIDHLLIRLLAFGLLLGVVSFWAQRHLGEAVPEKLDSIPIVSILIPFLIKLADLGGAKADDHEGNSENILSKLLKFCGANAAGRQLREWIRAVAKFVLQNEVLGLAWLIVLVTGCMFSS